MSEMEEGKTPHVRRVQGGVEPTVKRKKLKDFLPEQEKVTAEDVAASFAARKTKREQKREERPVRKVSSLVTGVLVVALGAGILGFGTGLSRLDVDHGVAVQTNIDKKADLEGTLLTLRPVEEETLSKTLAEDLNTTRERAIALAKAEQGFAEIAYEGNSEPNLNDGRPNPSILKSLEHRKELTGFFAPASLWLSDADAYGFRTQDLLEPGQIDPRQPWFIKYDQGEGSAETKRKAASPESYGWKVASVDLSDTPGLMVVIFTNVDKNTGDLLAWASTRYSVKENTFSNLSVRRSTIGDRHSLKAGSLAKPAGTQSTASTKEGQNA